MLEMQTQPAQAVNRPEVGKLTMKRKFGPGGTKIPRFSPRRRGERGLRPAPGMSVTGGHGRNRRIWLENGRADPCHTDMTPAERYQAVVGGERPDFLPRVPIVMRWAAEHIGSDYGSLASDHRVLVEAHLRCAEEFGFEQLSCISDPYRETAGFGASIKFHRHQVPECVHPPLADPSRLPGMRVPDPWEAERMRDRLEAVLLFRERDRGCRSVMGWVEGPAALAADLRGVSDFLMDLLEEPAWCADLLDLCTETVIRFALAQIKAGADTIGVGDAICSQISGPVYEDLILPRQQRLAAAIKQAGACLRLHICGPTMHLWEGIASFQPHIFDCDHMVPLAAARRALGPKVVLAGRLDPVSLLRFGSPEAIRQAVAADAAQAGFPCMVCAGCEIPSGTPQHNLHALCQPLPPPV